MNDSCGNGNTHDPPIIRMPMASGGDKADASKKVVTTIRKGERIPRRSLPQFEEASSFSNAIRRDGFLGTAMDDKNQFGPVGMMIMLLIVATITGFMIKMIDVIISS